MKNRDMAMEDVVAWLHSAVRGSIEVLTMDPDRLMLSIGRTTKAVIRVEVFDPQGPSFKVAFPALKLRRDGTLYVREVSAAGVTMQGLEWIVAELLEHGVVRPELE